MEDLYRSAAGCGADRAVGQALLLCERLLGTELAPSLKRQLQADRAQRCLAWLALLAMNRGGGAIELHELAFGSTLISLSHLLLIRGGRALLAHIARIATHPGDLQALPLPRRLRMAYPLLRLPLWCWRRCGAPRLLHAIAERYRALPLLAEAILWLLLARVLLAWLPFRRAARLFAWPVRTCYSPGAPREPARVRWAVHTAARRVPWRASCFHQAIAAQRMLCRRGIATDMVYGVLRTPGQTLEAHVWAAIAGRVIVGARAASAYTPIAVFRPGAAAAAAAHDVGAKLPRRGWRR